jgi:hypothetical protein
MVQRIHDDCAGLGATCKALPAKDDLYHSQVLKEGGIIKGSAGSGNFGHDGRKGKLGGSSKGGGLRRIGAKKDTPPGGRKKAAKKFREKREQDKKTKAKSKSIKLDKFERSALQNLAKSRGGKGFTFGPPTDIAVTQTGFKATTSQREQAKRFKQLKDKKLLTETKITDTNSRFNITDLGRKTLEQKSLTTKAQSNAPNYEPASTPQRCENCTFFRGDPGEDYCTRFDFTADQDYICDTWEAGRPDEIPGYVANKGDLARLTEGILILRGGRTSGNWGHAGRKGKRGGSGGGGGFKRIGVKPGASREKVKQAAKKKQAKAKPQTKTKQVTAKKKPEIAKKPQVKPKASKLDAIFDKAPKGSEKDFTNHLMSKMMNGEITLKEGQQLNQQFKDSQSKKIHSAPKTGNIKTAKKFTEAELKDGVAKKQWQPWKKKLSQKEGDALKAYSSEPFDNLSTDYTKMNNHLRGKDKKPSKETRDAIKQVDAAINKGNIPQDTTVFRGFPPSVLGSDPSKLVGKTITDKAYTSSSLSERVASQFSKDLIAEIKIPKGSKGAFMDATLNKSDLEQLGRDPEHELLLPRGSKFRISGTKKIGKKTKVFMELMQ